MDAILDVLDPKVLKRFTASVSIFTLFYLLLTELTYRWPDYLGPRYAQYAGVLQVDWVWVTASAIIFVFIAVLPGGVPRQFVRDTAIALDVRQAVTGILGVVGVFLVILLAFYAGGWIFPFTTEEILYLLPILSVAALAETFTFQWLLSRAFQSKWRYGFLWGAIVFALSHAGLTILTFVALVMLGIVFYYLTNPSGNLPVFVNLVFSAGIHVIYNVFAFAYGGDRGFLTISGPEGFTEPALVFWAILALAFVLVVVGEWRSRLHKVVA